MERLQVGFRRVREYVVLLIRHAPPVAQSMVEYAIIAAIIAVFAIAAANALGGHLSSAFANIGQTVEQQSTNHGGTGG